MLQSGYAPSFHQNFSRYAYQWHPCHHSQWPVSSRVSLDFSVTSDLRFAAFETWYSPLFHDVILAWVSSLLPGYSSATSAVGLGCKSFSLLILPLGDFIRSFDFSHHGFTDEVCIFTPDLFSKLQPYIPAFSLDVATQIGSPAWTHAHHLPTTSSFWVRLSINDTTIHPVTHCRFGWHVGLCLSSPASFLICHHVLSILSSYISFNLPIVCISVWNTLVPARHYFFPGPLIVRAYSLSPTSVLQPPSIVLLTTVHEHKDDHSICPSKGPSMVKWD